MGISNLNKITRITGSENCKANKKQKFDIVIIDGSNLISVFIYGCRNFYVTETNVELILTELTLNVIKMFVNKLNDIMSKYDPEEIILTFDPKDSPNYHFLNYYKLVENCIIKDNADQILNFNFKDAEREERKKQKEKTKDSEIFVYNDSNINSITGLIINVLVEMYQNSPKINIIETVDEADFVIKNIVTFYELLDKTILIISEDTDYIFLLCDSQNVYKTGAKKTTYGIIYNISKLWLNLLGTNDYDQLLLIPILAGCDYNLHSTLLDFSKPENYQQLFSNFNLISKQTKFMKGGYLKNVKQDNLLEIINNCSNKEQLVNIINLYKSWKFNNKFRKIQPDIDDQVNYILERFELTTFDISLYKSVDIKKKTRLNFGKQQIYLDEDEEEFN